MVGFTGSRSLGKQHEQLVHSLVSSIHSHGLTIAVGCAKGADAMVRKHDPQAELFAVASGHWGQGKNAYAARSAAMVKAIAQTHRSGLVGLVTSPCPSGIVPAKSWRSGKPVSGSWSTIALAAGLNVPIVVFLLGKHEHELPNWGNWATAGVGVWAGGWRLVA